MVALASACGQPEVETAQPAAMLAPGVPVTVTGGEIRGAPADGNPDLVVLQGVPYAAPPIGNLRWKPPQPVVAWDGVRDATAPGPICMQTGPAWVRAPTAGEDDPESEDCLFLNIWAPKEIQAPLPVMVWIHGGGFFNGAGSLPIYDGARIAKNDVVLVSINYRLSVFGFFAHPWTRFAATGNPNRDDLPDWPAFDPPAGRHLNLGETVTGGEGLHQAAGQLYRRFEASRRAGT